MLIAQHGIIGSQKLAGGPPPGLTYLVDLDATDAASYGGSGQTWANLGTLGTAADMYLGATSSATTDDPTFNGTAGDKAAYFSVDGGDYFVKQAANGTFLNGLHKNNTPCFAAVRFQLPNTSGLDTIFATTLSTGGDGLSFFTNGSNIVLQRRGDSIGNVNVGTFSANTWRIAVVTWEFGPSGAGYKSKMDAGSITSGAHGTDSLTNDASQKLTICGQQEGSGVRMGNGGRISHLIMGSGFLSDADMTTIYDDIAARVA